MKIQTGDRLTLELRPGRDGPRSVTGVVRSFQTEPRFDLVTGKQTEFSETRWEISTDDPQHPAIGFDPATAILTQPKD